MKLNAKTIVLAVVGAIFIGVALGTIIGLLDGGFKKSEPAPATTQSTKNVSDEEKAKQEAADKAAADKASGKSTETSSDATKTESTDSTKSESTTNNTNNTNNTTTNNTSTNTNSNTTAAAPAQTPPTAQPAQNTTATQSSGGKTGTVTVQGATLNMRSSNSLNSNVVGSVSGGQSVTILEHSNGMYRIRTATGSEAWVSDQYVAAS